MDGWIGCSWDKLIEIMKIFITKISNAFIVVLISLIGLIDAQTVQFSNSGTAYAENVDGAEETTNCVSYDAGINGHVKERTKFIYNQFLNII